MLKKLSLCLDKKMFADDMKAIDKQFRKLKERLAKVDIDDELIQIHESMNKQLTEMKKALTANELY